MPRRLALFERILGVTLVVGALVANPVVVERFLLLDGDLDHPGKVLAAEAFGVAAGVFLYWHGRRAGSALSARVHGGRTAKVLLAIGATLLTLPAAEWILRKSADPLMILRGSRFNEARWRRFHVGGANPNLAYDSDTYDAELGWKPKAGFERDHVRTNSQGFRADRDYSVARPVDRHRIVVVGDSFSWGEEVGNDETYAHDLEGLLPDTEVLNVAVHGYGTDQQLLRLRRSGLQFQPDLVILGFFEENLDRNLLSFRDYAKPWFDLEGGELRLHGVPVPRQEEILARPEIRPRWFLPDLVCGFVDHALDRTRLRPLEDRDSWKITRALFDETRRSAEASGARFMLVFIPFGVGRTVGAIERSVQGWASSTHTPLVDMREVFARRPESEWGSMYLKIHWSARGNQVAAEAMRDEILRDDLLRTHANSVAPSVQASLQR
jgi:hypothetical protein